MSAPHSPESERHGALPLDDEERQALVRLARDTIVARLHEAPLPAPRGPQAFEARAGAFVTVTVSGDLRGCIGIPEPSQPLADVVQHCAQAAAFQDPRFPPVRANELPSLAVEVSVLSPMRPLTDPAGLVVGRHGLVVERGWHRGLLLPQVAVEHGWTAVQFLAQTCRKAGLPPDAWRDGAKLWVFEADVIPEPTA